MKGQQKPKKGQKKAPQKTLKEKRAEKRAPRKPAARSELEFEVGCAGR